MGKKVNLNDIDRRQRAEADRERRKAEAERIAASKERSFKRAFGQAFDRLLSGGGYGNDRPHLHKSLKSPAGETADKGPKWVRCLPGSFETGKRR
jgi:hypothetical protein